MTDEQLNIAVAEIVMGWKWNAVPADAEWADEDTKRLGGFWLKGTTSVNTTNPDGSPNCPNYSTDIAEAWKVQSRIMELGLMNEFIHELGKLMPPKFNLATVGPRERCIAALKAVGAEL